MEQRTDEWHAMRADKIGGSDAPIIMKVSPYKTPLQLWKEKLGLAKAAKPHPGMIAGIQKEPIFLAKFNKDRGFLMTPQVVVSQSRPWMMASLDGLDITGDEACEIKLANLKDHELVRRGIIPEKYYPQLQHQLEVGRFSVVYYVSCYQEEQLVIPVTPDRPYIEELVEREEEFYEKLMSWEPPEKIAADTKKKDLEERDDALTRKLVQRWIELSAEKSRIEILEKAAREDLAKLAKENGFTCQGVEVTPSQRAGSIDYKAIPELHGVDLECYRKPPVGFHRIVKVT